MGGWLTSRLGRFTPGKEIRYPFYRRLGGLRGRSGEVRKISPLPGFDPRTVQHAASRYTYYAIPAHTLWCIYSTYSILNAQLYNIEENVRCIELIRNHTRFWDLMFGQLSQWVLLQQNFYSSSFTAFYNPLAGLGGLG